MLAEDGYQFEVVPAVIEEPTVKDSHIEPELLAEALAYFKGREVADKVGPGCVVLAADTVVTVDGQIYGKPEDADDARAMLKTLSHNVHEVITAVSLIDTDSRRRVIDFAKTTMTMTPMSCEQIEDYVDTGEWRGKAGGYAVQEGADKFVVNMEGSFSNVVGLPMELVRHMLASFDIHPHANAVTE